MTKDIEVEMVAEMVAGTGTPVPYEEFLPLHECVDPWECSKHDDKGCAACVGEMCPQCRTEAEYAEEDVEPEFSVRSRPFAKKVAELEGHVDELTDQSLVRFEVVENDIEDLRIAIHTINNKLADYATTLAGIRKLVNESDNMALRAEVKRLHDRLWQHLQHGD
jgi:hypothetical protein